MKKIKKYYRIEFELTSPLSVGCGEDRISDSDIVRDSRGIPYIPGTSLAGVYRRLFAPETAKRYFGTELTQEMIKQSSQEGRNLLEDSSVVVYDAYPLHPEKGVSVNRDMVALDEYKVAKPGAKFDFEVLEPGITFVTYIEQNMDRPDQQYVLDEIALAWLKGQIKVGAKTARGYGHTKGVEAVSQMFDLNDAIQREKWLDFDMYSDPDKDGKPAWNLPGIPNCLNSMCEGSAEYKKTADLYKDEGIYLAEREMRTVTLDLRLRGGISIRRYSTDTGAADYVQLTEKGSSRPAENDEGIPVIPGTSWAGAFRAQMGRLDSRFQKEHDLAELFFGKAKERSKDNSQKSSRSRIEFSESRLAKGRWVTYTRNAIDRFSGGTVAGALYTEKTYYHGETELQITCDFTGIADEEKEQFARTMAAAIMDLHSGYMAVGGLTAVGRGLFEVRQITADGRQISLSDNNAAQDFLSLTALIAGKGE